MLEAVGYLLYECKKTNWRIKMVNDVSGRVKDLQ